MTQATLPLSAPPAKVTLTDRLAAYFRARPGQWLDGRELSTVAGAYAWRSRVSDLRRPPFTMTITNRVRVVLTMPRGCLRISEYRYVPEAR